MLKKELPKAYNPTKVEDSIYKKWEGSGFFNPDNLNLPKKAPPYTIVMPPPNVTGVLHMGTGMMLAIEDLLIRYHRMKGYRALWLPGTDHAAIATQSVVEKILKEKKGLTRHDLGREKFLVEVQKFIAKTKDTIKSQIKKMGSSCDWSREAYTLDEVRSKIVREIFIRMYKDGLVYRGDRIVNWCPRCASTLADDEVEYKESSAKLYTFRYDKNFPFAIATTRPETKLGDTAVAVHPDDARYKKYIGKTFSVNLGSGPMKIKVIADKSIDPEFGTGALGVTPAHSAIDFEMAKKHNLPIVKVIDEAGRITGNTGKYKGMTTFKAREILTRDLKKRGLLKKVEDIIHNLSLCYRCGAIIEPLTSLQWFIDVNKKIPKYKKSLKELSIEAVKKGIFGRGKIKIIPERFEKVYCHWMENLHDWCISRQIWFGHQIPVWYKNEEVYVGDETPRSKGWEQDPDTLDTWFSSGLWTFSTLLDKNLKKYKTLDQWLKNSPDLKTYHPTSVLETMYDILFFWVARMIIMTIYAVEDIPFEYVYLHGCVRDKYGDKMSKSKPETCIDPLDVCKKYGTDAVRLSLIIGTAPGSDVKVYEEKIAGFRNFVNKLWNISRYILMSVKDTTIDSQKIEPKTLADKWILSRFNKVEGEATEYLEKFNFSQAGETLRDFTWNEFADWYIEVSKIENKKDKILIHILKDLLRLWHPYMPFVTEIIWENFKSKNLLIVDNWPKVEKKLIDEKIEKDFKIIQDIITSIRNTQADYKIEPVKKLPAIIFAGAKSKLIEDLSETIKTLARLSGLTIKKKDKKPAQSISLVVAGIEIYLPLAGIIDIEKEKIRINREIKSTEKYIMGIGVKLKNEGFISKAPEKVIEEEKERLKEAMDKFERLKEQLKSLQ